MFISQFRSIFTRNSSNLNFIKIINDYKFSKSNFRFLGFNHGNSKNYEYQQKKSRKSIFGLHTARPLMISILPIFTVIKCEDRYEGENYVSISKEEYDEIHRLRKVSRYQGWAITTSFSGILGYACGYATREIGNIILLVVGTIFMAIQVMSYYGYLNIDWDRVKHRTSSKFTKEKRQKFYQTFYGILTHNLPFKVGFGSGFLIGLRGY
ncbi:cystine knot domain-containing protein [Tieghemostelium lacteum]|uniref:Cystine knot domain-containing protein n=1 Tax=Tieghemostelium lacteum TaxID=361077 RepID=A0A152A3Z7_TIELA|nr:cystine knot domain-containing protein [Tieghemostelium lacteum]|eukprot:KYR00946.1 cystine knot domain-containing protein [Tieghemostelium lacteum]